MVRFIIMVMVALFPFALSAQKEVVASYPITGYALGKYDARALGREIALENNCKLEVVGSADATPYRKGNSALLNQALANRRASEVGKLLVASGVSPERIDTRGEVSTSRGPQYRGVTVYVVCEKIAAPNDSLSTVSKEVDTLKTAVHAVEKKVEKLDTAVTQVTQVVQQIINADTGKKEEVKKNESWIDLGLGVGFNSAYAGGTKESSLNVGGGLFMKPRGLPFQLLFRGGYWPKGQNKEWKCHQADATLSLGAHKVMYEAETFSVGASAGGFTDRRYCSNGGVKLAEQWTSKVDGLYAGPSFQVPMFGSLHMWAAAELTYGGVTTAEELYKSKNAFGFRTSAMVRWAPTKNKNNHDR